MFPLPPYHLQIKRKYMCTGNQREKVGGGRGVKCHLRVIAFTCLVLAHCPHFTDNCINLLFALFCLSFSLSLLLFLFVFCRAQQSGAAAAGCVGGSGGGGGQSRSGSRKLPPPLLRSRTLPAIILPGLPAVSLHTDKQTFHLGA